MKLLTAVCIALLALSIYMVTAQYAKASTSLFASSITQPEYRMPSDPRDWVVLKEFERRAKEAKQS